VIGDPATLEKIPNFRGFPTTMVLDRSGKVRLLITENSTGTPELLDDAVQVLLAEPAQKAAGSDAPVKPKS